MVLQPGRGGRRHPAAAPLVEKNDTRRGPQPESNALTGRSEGLDRKNLRASAGRASSRAAPLSTSGEPENRAIPGPPRTGTAGLMHTLDPTRPSSTVTSSMGAEGLPSVRQIVRKACDQLSEEHRTRVWVALEEPNRSVAVDADVLSATLTSLVGRAAEARSAEILLRAMHEGETTLFVVVSHPMGETRSEESGGGEPTKMTALIEGISRLGGELSLQVMPAGSLRAVIRLPRNPNSREGVAA